MRRDVRDVEIEKDTLIMFDRSEIGGVRWMERYDIFRNTWNLVIVYVMLITSIDTDFPR